MNTSTKKRAGLFGWAAIALLAVVYSPMAVEYMWRFFNPDAPQLWDHAFSSVVDHNEAYGAGSIHADQESVYQEHRFVLLFHTVAGGLAILLFSAQFSAKVRSNLRRHRALGRTAVTLTLVGMIGAMAYLLSVGPHDTFDGPGFWIQLWGLAIGTAVAVSLGFAAAVKRQIAMHRALMTMAFALLLTAPLLRAFYLLLGNLWPDVTQLETNFAGGAFLGTWAPFGAFLVSRLHDGRGGPNPRIAPLPGKMLDMTIVASVIVATPLLVSKYADSFAQVDRITVTGLVGFVAALILAMVNLVTVRRQGDEPAADEWRIVTLSLLAAAPSALVLWWLYDIPFAPGEAFLGTLLSGQALPLYAGFFLIVWRRRSIRKAPTSAPSSELATQR